MSQAIMALLLLIAALWLPGTFFSRAAGLPWGMSLAVSPAVSAGIIAVGSFISGFTSASWGWPLYLGLAAACVGLAGVAALPAKRALVKAGQTEVAEVGEKSLSAENPRAARFRYEQKLPELNGSAILGTALGAVVMAVPVWRGQGDFYRLLQNGDALFHLNALRLVEKTGNASPLGALNQLTGQRAGDLFYPTGWHALGALLLPVADGRIATNVMLVAIPAMAWGLGMAMLARLVLGKYPAAAFFAPVIGAVGVQYPIAWGSFTGTFPHFYAVSLLPAVLILIYLTVSSFSWKRYPWWVTLLAAVLGLGCAHFSMLAVAIIALVVMLAFVPWPRGRNARIGRAGFFASAAVLLVAFVNLPAVKNLASWVPLEGSRTQGLREAVDGTAFFSAQGSGLAGYLITAICVAGILVLLRCQESWWVIPLYLLGAFAYIVAKGPNGRLRNFTGLWYMSPERIAAFWWIFAVLLMAALLAWVSNLVVRGVNAMLPVSQAKERAAGKSMLIPDRGQVLNLTLTGTIALIFIGASNTAFLESRQLYASVMYSYKDNPHVWVESWEVPFLERLGKVLPPDAVIIGDPENGAGHTQAISGLTAVLTSANTGNITPEQLYLVQHFNRIQDDPKVCQILQKYQVSYFYEDASNNDTYGNDFPGFYDVDTSRGFELVDQEMTAKLWRITACQADDSGSK